MEGDPKFEASQQMPNVPYHKFAELIGLRGIYVDEPDAAHRLGGGAGRRPPGCDRGQDRPEVPPLPPHITLEQARNFGLSLIKGDPQGEGRAYRETMRQADERAVSGTAAERLARPVEGAGRRC